MAQGHVVTGTAFGRRLARWIVAGLALLAITLALAGLLRDRAGLDRVELRVGQTPATLTTLRGAPPGPLVVIAHGFAGSRQFMEAFSLTLARAGYAALTFDFLGHGRNPVPMSGDVTQVGGTTRLLMDQIDAVIAAGRARPEVGPGLALVGHSMATDVIVRAALRRADVDTVAAVSMYSEAVTATAPPDLLIVTGQAEPPLRAFALGALQQVDPSAAEGETAVAGDVRRRAVVARGVEHVGVLYSATALREVRDWLDTAFGRQSTGPVTQNGPLVALLLAGILALGWPLSGLVPQRVVAPQPAWRALAVATLLPALVTPLVLWPAKISVLPVLVADYLVLHLGLYGVLQLAVLWRLGVRPARGLLWPAALLLLWGGLFALALDRFGASFAPQGMRWAIVAAMALGAVPFMLGDAVATAGGAVSIPKRIAVRGAVFASLGLAVALDFEGLFFLVLILPIILLFFLIFGTMGGWIGRRAGPVASGVALGLILAWSIGVSFPLFQS